MNPQSRLAAIATTAPGKPTPCPGCGATMQPQRLPRNPLGEVTVDLCVSCQALWFDSFESVQLTPGATLALFDTIRKAPQATGRGIAGRLPCPRCTHSLVVTHDLQRTTRFTYYRCPEGHGRFTPFVQFLLEKNFIRPLAPAELARLKATIRIIRCSSCGGPVDLYTDAACPYCRAPIAILDADAVDATVRSLEAAEARRKTVDIEALVDGMLDAHRHASAAEESPLDAATGTGTGVDLVHLGLMAVARLLER